MNEEEPINSIKEIYFQFAEIAEEYNRNDVVCAALQIVGIVLYQTVDIEKSIEMCKTALEKYTRNIIELNEGHLRDENS